MLLIVLPFQRKDFDWWKKFLDVKAAFFDINLKVLRLLYSFLHCLFLSLHAVLLKIILFSLNHRENNRREESKYLGGENRQ